MEQEPCLTPTCQSLHLTLQRITYSTRRILHIYEWQVSLSVEAAAELGETRGSTTLPSVRLEHESNTHTTHRRIKREDFLGCSSREKLITLSLKAARAKSGHTPSSLECNRPRLTAVHPQCCKSYETSTTFLLHPCGGGGHGPCVTSGANMSTRAFMWCWSTPLLFSILQYSPSMFPTAGLLAALLTDSVGLSREDKQPLGKQ